MAVSFVTRLRDEIRFQSREALQLEMAADVERTRKLLAVDIHSVSTPDKRYLEEEEIGERASTVEKPI